MRIRFGVTFIIIFFLSIIFVPQVRAADYEGKIVKLIQIKGNKRIDKATIRYYIKTDAGDRYSTAGIREDIKRIYNIGHFKDVKVDVEDYYMGVKITFIVTEIASIKNIHITGNKKIDKSTVEEKISVKKGSAYNKNLIQESIENIKLLYKEKGYFFAEIEYAATETKENQIDLEFRIKEGKKVRISNIRFKGNKVFSEKKLAKQIETRKQWILSWLTNSGIYKKEVLKTDILRIESFYHNHGYINVRVYEPEVEIDRENRAIFITIPIEEGDKYYTGRIDIKGSDIYSADELKKEMRLKKNEVFNRSLMRSDIFRMSDLFSKKGYAFADIIPLTSTDKEDKKVDITIDINKGRKVYVGKINIAGNTKTRDRIIRREFRFKEGELFDSEKLRRSRQRIGNLGFFEDMKIETSRGAQEDLIDINTTVTERPTGSISVGAGFSSVEEIIFTGQIAQDNFLGRGQRLSLSAQLSSIRQDFTLNFTEPRVFDRELSAGFDIYNRESLFYSYRSRTRGGGIRLGKSFGEYIWGKLGYRYDKILVFDVQQETTLLKNEERTTSRIYPTLTRDTRDDFLNPSKGTRERVSFEFAGGPLGGANFYKASGEVSWYHPLLWKFVGMLHGKIGFAEGYDKQELPVFENYFMGSAFDLRGFNFRDVGPRDVNGDSIGGSKLLLLNAEIQYPFTKNVRGIIFYDRGNVYGEGPDLSKTSVEYDLTNMRHGYGFGIHFLSPMGPISLAYGFKLDRRADEDKSEFHFTAGRVF
ncbi:MAG: outer membrane protein assembly factor BamA [Nitrospinota bacterium]